VGLRAALKSSIESEKIEHKRKPMHGPLRDHQEIKKSPWYGYVAQA